MSDKTKKVLSAEERRLLAALGREIASRRQDQGLIQMELSSRAGVHCNAISRLERGLTNVSVLVLFALTKELDCTLSELFVGPVRH